MDKAVTTRAGVLTVQLSGWAGREEEEEEEEDRTVSSLLLPVPYCLR